MAQNTFCQYLFNKSVQFSDFMNYEKQPGETMEEYVNHFDRMYRNLEKHKVLQMENEGKSFLLLNNAKLDKIQQDLVLSKIRYEEKNTLYLQMKIALIKFESNYQKIEDAHPEPEEETVY